MNSLIQILHTTSSIHRDKTAFVFLEDGDNRTVEITYSELWKKTKNWASGLSSLKLFQKPVLLLYPPGIDYIEAFLSCISVGIIAVPIYPPRSSKHAERLNHILKDSGAKTILTTPQLKEKLNNFDQKVIGECNILCLEDLTSKKSVDFEEFQAPKNIAFIQYTSGSTGNPKGVIVSNQNLIENEEQLRLAGLQNSSSIIVSWLPMYHDMGLIGNILHNIYIGSKCVFFAPVHFLQSPVRWLKAISKYKATLSGAPNFAYDLLNKLEINDNTIDLSSLDVLFNGAEKVRYDTLFEFEKKFLKYGLNPKAIYPCYGLAEATLMIAGADRNSGFKILKTNKGNLKNRIVVEQKNGDVVLVSSGKVREGSELCILDQNGIIQEPNQIGTIYIAGKNVTSGYWNNRSPELFIEINQKQFVNTGDLGCLFDGELYITGRQKEIIIKNGVNYYPYDIERLVTNSSNALAENGCAVISVDKGKQEELVVIAEVKRSMYRTLNEEEVYHQINQSLSSEQGFVANDIVLISPMSIPKTSSGKIQRNTCHEMYLDGQFRSLGSLLEFDKENDPTILETEKISLERASENRLAFLYQEINQILGENITLTKNTQLHEIGLDSIKLMQFSATVEEAFNVKISLDFLYNDITIGDLKDEIEKKESNESTLIQTDRTVSANQEGLWLANENGLTKNNIGFSFGITGGNWRQKLNDSLREVLKCLGYKGANFKLENGELKQTFSEENLFNEVVLETADEFNETVKKYNQNNTDLEHDSLLNLIIFYNQKQEETEVHFMVHHIISDGASLAILFDLWLMVLKGKQITPIIGSNWQKRIEEELVILNNKNLVTKAFNYFKQTTASQEVNSLLAIQKDVEEEAYFHADWDRANIKVLADQHNVSPFILLLTTYHLALSYLTSSNQICTVTPFSNRVSYDQQSQFGYLVNLMYLKSEFDGRETVEDFLNSMKNHVKNTLKYQMVPYVSLLRQANFSQEVTNALGLFYFAYHSFEGQDQFRKLFEQEKTDITTIEGGIVFNRKQLHQKGNFKMELEVFEYEKNLRASLKIEKSHFSSKIGIEVLEIMENILKEMNASSNKKLSDIPFLDKEKMASILSCGRGEINEIEENHFLELFDKSVVQFPNNIAIEQEGNSLTYKELAEQSDELAAILVNQYELNTGECVLVRGNYQLVDLVSILSVMKAGGVYVPVNNDFPEERQRLIAEDCNIRIGFSDDPISFCTQLNAEELLKGYKNKYKANRSDIGYLIYTSGTTGEPKGVEINQKGIVNLCYSMIKAFEIKPVDKVLQFAALSFDMSVEEIFPYWAAGATVVMRTEEESNSLSSFTDYCNKSKISILNLPTAFWTETIAIKPFPNTVRLVSVGGEAMNENAKQEWFKFQSNNVKIFNAYGPTEYTVNTTLKELSAKDTLVTIGKPILNTKVLIVNNQKKVVPIGVVGELIVFGAGLANGYLNRQKENNAFSTFILPDGSKEKTYCTGDLAYINDSNEIVILGRKDKQVKVRGYRVDINAIQAIIEQDQKVSKAIVIVFQENLVAFVCVNDKSFDSEKCKNRLIKKLPAYFIPSQINVLDKIPVSIHGKVNEKELAKIIELSTVERIDPVTEMEHQLVAIWKEILGIDKLSVTQSFFDVGGHSIKAIKLLAQIELKFGKKISLKTLYETLTIRKLSEFIESLIWIDNSVEDIGEVQDELVI